MRYLVDANVLSESTKRKPESRVLQWLADHRFDTVVSVLTLGEIERGILPLPHGERRNRLMAWFINLADALESEGRVMPVDRPVVSRWAVVHLREERLTKRKPPAIDTILAATAELHGLTMVSRNEKDFPAGLPLVNPWKL